MHKGEESTMHDEVFAPMARLDTVRFLIALAAHKGWEMHHMDAKSAFLMVSSRKKCLCSNQMVL
jgi:hypothetical protein